MQKFFKFTLCIAVVIFMTSFLPAQETSQTDWIENFNVTDGGFADIGWWNASTVTQMADPTPRGEGGVIAWTFEDASVNGVGINKANVDGGPAKNHAIWMYLPSDTPDSTVIRFFGQTKPQWSHRDSIINYAMDLPKETWFPLIFPLEAYYIADSAGFNHHAADGFGWYGLQIISPGAWGGTVYLDDLVRLGTQGDRISYFDAGTDIAPWSDAAWGDALSVLQVIDDPTGSNRGGVLEAGINGTRGTVNTSQYQTTWSEEDLSYMVYLPADFPDSMLFRTAFQDNSNWSDNFYIDLFGVDLPKEKWIQIDWPIKTFYMTDSSKLTPYPPNQIGRIYLDFQALDAAATSYSGSVYFDEFDLLSSEISTVPVKLESPVVTTAAAIDTLLDATTEEPLYYHHIEWEDLNPSAGETYNVYMSEVAPITEVSAADVVTLAKDVPRGTQEWNHSLYEDLALTRYYAVTATGIEGTSVVEKPVRPDTSNTGPITSTAANKYNAIPLVESFDFAADGDLNEFVTLAETFPTMVLENQQCAGDAYTDAGYWDTADLSFTAYLVMTTDNFYIGFDVYDDYPDGDGADGNGQAWAGDGIDLFGVMTDVTDATSYYFGTNAPSGGAGGYRISYGINAATVDEQLQKNGGAAWSDAEGVDHSREKFDDGYVIEIMVPWTRMAAEFNSGGDVFVPATGMQYLTKIDVNDDDNEAEYDSSRSMQCHWGGVPGNVTSWERAEGWTPMKITDTPLGTAIEDEGLFQPRSTTLYDNYPNPFNPKTTIKYQLDKATDVKVTIYNAIGQKVRTLINKKQNRGEYQVYWHGTDDSGRHLPTGIYFLQFETVDYSRVQKMVLLK